MIKHYLKIAFRNLWKYKNQTLISVVGLAVGFTCFAVAALWIRYEMTYDTFHKNADRMYCVYMPDVFNPGERARRGPYPLAIHLKATFPEIAHATTLAHSDWIYMEGVFQNVDILEIDSSFFSMFNVKIIEGSMEFLIPESNKIAITQEKARQLFGNESPIGKVFNTNQEYTVCAVVKGLPKRSNYPFDFLIPLSLSFYGDMEYVGSEHTLIELLPDVDVKMFETKLYEHTARGNVRSITKMTITPLTAVHYKDPNIRREVQFQHIIIFSVAGSLLILCTLFNYLTLFVSRFRIRQRELALRTICGASNRSLFTLLSVEFVMSLMIALLLGLFFVRMAIPLFRRLSGIRLELSSIYLESSVYIAGIILLSLSAFFLVLIVFRRKTLHMTIRKSNKKLSRKISIVVQLIISIGFAFCTIIIVKQMYYLHNTDLGFAFKNRGSVIIVGPDLEMIENKIQQIPEITETLRGFSPLLPYSFAGTSEINHWDDKSKDAEPINMQQIMVSEQYLTYYEIKLIEGEMLNEQDDTVRVLINESAAKAFGWHKAVGKSFKSHRNYKVKGVIRNIYNYAPTIPTKPAFYRIPLWIRMPEEYEGEPSILFKYNEGTWKTCKEKIEKILKEEYPDIPVMLFNLLSNTEEEYDKFLKSENVLLKLLMLISLVCVFICVFGFVSMVSLTCEERRKEIAIRKVSGATVKDILDIFFKEYLTLLAIGALIAFPAGYIIMKRWLEQYVVQTEISAWIYVAILLALILAIVLCVGGKVYKTSRENPVKAIQEN